MIKSILDLNCIPAGMEAFPATDQSQLQYINKIIDQCDYYVIIIGARYGSIDDEGVSFTEREYDYALGTGKTILAFIHSDPDSIPAGRTDKNPALEAKLVAFKDKISSGRLVKFWSNEGELKSNLVVSLIAAISEFPATGWVRGDSIASPKLLEQLNTLRNEVEELRSENSKLKLSLAPHPEEAANLEDKFEIRYTHKTYGRYDAGTKHTSLKISWSSILGAIGPEILKPAQPEIINYAISRYIRENINNLHGIEIYKSDCNIVKVHLMALSLIDVYSAEQVGGGVVEFVKITDKGLLTLSRLLMVRKDSNLS